MLFFVTMMQLNDRLWHVLLFGKEIITLAVRPITYCQHNKMNQNKCAFCQEDGVERLGPLGNKQKKKKKKQI